MHEESYSSIRAELQTGDLILGTGTGHTAVPLGVVIRAQDIAHTQDLGHPLILTPKHRVRILADLCQDLDLAMVRVVTPAPQETQVSIGDIASRVLDRQDPRGDSPLLGQVRVQMAAHHPQPAGAFTDDAFGSIFGALGPDRALMRMTCPHDGRPELCPAHSGRRQ